MQQDLAYREARRAFTFRTRVVRLGILLGCANIGAWIWTFVVFHNSPILLGTALLAYALGLRHAVDADHIAAIDNVTRKLVQEGKRPASVGLFFSLGHATIVVIGSVLAYSMASVAEKQFGWVKSIGAVVGTSVSAAFLITIALVNLIVLGRLWRDFRDLRDGRSRQDQSQDVLSGGGLLTRMLRPVFRMLSKPWHMYPVGFLFGLGFDTATEIAVLGISATAATKGLAIGAMAVFPFLFAVGMTLVDTADGILMVKTYGWAFVKPDRKLYYNFAITIISVAIALVIAGIEAVGLLKDQLNLTGRLSEYVNSVINSFGAIGFATILLFVAIWLGSVAFSRLKGVREV